MDGPAAVASSVMDHDHDVSLAPTQLLPPLYPSAHSLPSQPFPSAIDSLSQPSSMVSTVSGINPATGAVTNITVRKRFHVTDGVRMSQRQKKKRVSHGIHDGGISQSTRELPDHIELDGMMHQPQSAMLQQLLALERRIDATIARKEVAIAHALSSSKQSGAIIRLFLWHEQSEPVGEDTAAAIQLNHQPMNAADHTEETCWMLKIQGHVLEADEGVHSSNAPVSRCFSNMISSLMVHVEERPMPQPITTAAQPPPGETFEWHKHSSVTLCDGFEIRRRGKGEFHCTITICLDHAPMRYRLSPQLAQLLGLPLHAPNPLPSIHANKSTPHPFPSFETAATVTEKFWEYVQRHRLYAHESNNAQNVGNLSSLSADGAANSASIVHCDAALKSLLGMDTIPADSVLSVLQQHMIPSSTEPIIIPFTIRTHIPSADHSLGLAPPPASGQGARGLVLAPSPSPVVCYDILTYAPLPASVDAAFKEAAMTNPTVKWYADTHTKEVC